MLIRLACLNPPMRNTRGKFTFDQLLETKRAEKPSTDFWADFNNELRIKQRRLLQQQPVENLGIENAFWHKFRKIGVMCVAAASCGAVGFVVMQSVGPVVISSTAFVETPNLNATIVDQTNFEVVQSLPVTNTPAQPKFVKVPVSIAQIESVKTEIQEDKAIAVLGSNSSSAEPIANDEGFTLAMQTPFESLEIDETIEFNAHENITTTLMERYLHPLGDRGLSYTKHVASRTDPLNRVTAIALKSDFFNSDSRSDSKLNTLSLRF